MNTRLTLIGVLVLACKRFLKWSCSIPDLEEYSQAAQRIVDISMKEF